MHRAAFAVSAAAAAAALAGCGPEEAARSMTAATTAVVNLLDMPAAENNVAPGFDLDGISSDRNDGRGCFQPDLVGPTGEQGIDNQISTLVPLIDLAGEGALEALVQQSINEGRLLVFIELMHMDDGTVDVRVRRGEDVPLLGTDGRILSGQTLALHPEPMLGHLEGGKMNGDTLEVGPFHLELPVIVFSKLYVLVMPEARMRLTVAPDGRYTSGLIGGGVPLEVLIGIVEEAGEQLPSDFVELMMNNLRESTDLARAENGDCGQLSVAIRFEAVPSFVF